VISRWILLIPALAAALAACGPEEPAEPKLDFIGYPIINGSPDTSQAHMAVVGVRSQFGMCSGTLIHDRVVMTAAHCVDGDTASQILVGFGNNINPGGGTTWVSVVDKWQHPSYNGGSQNITYDIALVRMSTLPPVAVTPIPHLPESLQITTADVGSYAEYVGFGQTDPYDDDSAGVKMTMTNQIEWVCYSASCSGWNNPGNNNTFCQDQSPSGTCFGDSGGPAFITRSGTEYAAGIASYVGGNCQYFSCHTKVDEYEYYILDFIYLPNGTACFTDDECESNICSDGVCCNTDCSGACMACDLPGSLGQCRAAPDGYECPDSNPCDGTETCQNGVCTESPDLDCDDNNACTTDTCNPSTGCVHTMAADGTSCSDNNICNGLEFCQSGYCAPGTNLICDDGDACTIDTCHPVSGCQYAQAPDGTNCPDSNRCNGDETCQSGVCVDGPDLNCDDNNVCTSDSCNPMTGCIHSPAQEGLSCSDNNVCNGLETCQGGICRSGGPLDCDDGDDCTFESCHPIDGCQYTPAPDGTACGDNKDCTGSNSCQNGVCVPGSGAVCDDGNACTSDQCIPGTGCVYDDLPDSTPCHDGNPCTTNDICQSGICAGTAVDCNDNNPCTEDSCDLASGCVHTPLADGTGCGGGVCGQAVCVQGVCEPLSGAGCDDHDPCTDDWCDPEQGCMHEALPDGWECGECYMCVGGQCMRVTDCGEEGCGCGNSGHELPFWGVLSLLALLVVRRRR